MKFFCRILSRFIWANVLLSSCFAQQQRKRFNALVLFENGGHHIAYSTEATKWLNKLAADSNFSISYIHNTKLITAQLLAQYQLFIQLDYPPYGWKDAAAKAFEQYMEQGKGGWIGFHHASLLGEFDGYPIWPWFRDFMGGIRFVNYIPSFVDGVVTIEDSLHPCFKNMPRQFVIPKEEWYTYDKSPRQQVQVLAHVDESGYYPASAIKMGDHPVIWSNTIVAARNIYIFMGHSPTLFKDIHYTTLFRNSIFWAAGQVVAPKKNNPAK